MRLTYDFHIHTALSPCGDNDMTPGNLAGMAALAGLLGSLETPWPGGTSPLCRHLPRKDGAVLGARLRPGILRELADPDNPTYAFLRSDPRFWDLVGEAPAAP